MKRCRWCAKEKEYLFFDKWKGIDCPDIEGEFCLECIKEINPDRYRELIEP